jgi:hypothetical protein
MPLDFPVCVHRVCGVLEMRNDSRCETLESYLDRMGVRIADHQETELQC